MSSIQAVTEDLVGKVQDAHRSGTTLRIRGFGSKDFLGQSLGGEILSTLPLSGIIAYEPSELFITAATGTPLSEIEAVLAERNQYLPFEPPQLDWSGKGAQGTLGGMVASGLAGPARANAGGVRDYVLGLKFINGKGEHLTFGGQVMKNVAGYDISRLMVGAMGTLGLITEVSLKVLPLPAAEATLVFGLSQSAALEQMHRWGATPLPLNASCWIHAGMNAEQTGDCLYVRLRGAKAAVDAACQRMLQDARGEKLDTTGAACDWSRLRNQTLTFFVQGASRAASEGLVLWRLSVPQTTHVLQSEEDQLIEWHGALRWVWATPQQGQQLALQARKAGGSGKMFFNPHKLPLPAMHGEVEADDAKRIISARLKESFDPRGIFNPGRM